MENHWSFLAYENGLSHVVSADLRPTIEYDMAHQDPPGEVKFVRPVTEAWFELGGACVIGRPHESLPFCGLTIEIPSEDLDLLLQRWRAKPVVTAAGRCFRRLTCWPNRCLVVDLQQHIDLIKLLEASVAQANQRATDFYVRRERVS